MKNNESMRKTIMSENFIKVNKNWLVLLEKETANMNYGEIMLLSEIDSLSYNKKHNKACAASNAYFADLLCTDERTIKRYLKKMKDLEIIKTFEQRQGMKTTSRFIHINHNKINELIAGDKNCQSKGQNLSEQVTKIVKAGDKNDTLIRNNKKEKESIKDISFESANAEPLKKKDDVDMTNEEMYNALQDKYDSLSNMEQMSMSNKMLAMNNSEKINREKTSRKVLIKMCREFEILDKYVADVSHVDSELIYTVMEMFRQKCKYKEIASETGLSFDEIGSIISQNKDLKIESEDTYYPYS